MSPWHPMISKHLPASIPYAKKTLSPAVPLSSGTPEATQPKHLESLVSTMLSRNGRCSVSPLESCFQRLFCWASSLHPDSGLDEIFEMKRTWPRKVLLSVFKSTPSIHHSSFSWRVTYMWCWISDSLAAWNPLAIMILKSCKYLLWFLLNTSKTVGFQIYFFRIQPI